MVRTIDTYRSVDRSVTAQITFNDQFGLHVGNPYAVELRRSGVNHGFRFYPNEDRAREWANDWIENPERFEVAA